MAEINGGDIWVRAYSVQRTGWDCWPYTGVEILHLPSGISVRRDSERSQHANRHAAMEALRAAVAEWQPPLKAEDVRPALVSAKDVLTRSRHLLTLLGGQEHLIDWKAVDKLKADIDEVLERLEPQKAEKCDGNHGGPRCADPECWNNDPHYGECSCDPMAGPEVGAHCQKCGGLPLPF